MAAKRIGNFALFLHGVLEDPRLSFSQADKQLLVSETKELATWTGRPPVDGARERAELEAAEAVSALYVPKPGTFNLIEDVGTFNLTEVELLGTLNLTEVEARLPRAVAKIKTLEEVFRTRQAAAQNATALVLLRAYKAGLDRVRSYANADSRSAGPLFVL